MHGALQIKAASKQAGVATASMGKFDARLPGEKPGERSMGPKRKEVGPVASAPGQEGKKVDPPAYSLTLNAVCSAQLQSL